MQKKETRMEKRRNELINKECVISNIYLLVMAVCNAVEKVGSQKSGIDVQYIVRYTLLIRR
jgi:hypothetical protein